MFKRFLFVLAFVIGVIVLSLAVVITPFSYILFNRILVKDVADWMDKKLKK